MNEEREARRAATQAALARLDVWADHDDAPLELIEDLRMHHERRLARLDGEHAGGMTDEATRGAVARELRRDLLDAERRALVDLRDRGVIGDDALRRVQRDLDLDEVRLDAETR